MGDVGSPRPYVEIEMSPDGSRLAFNSVVPGEGDERESDLWILDLNRGTSERLTSEPGAERTSMWSPDGRSVAFVSIARGRFRVWVQSITTGERSLILDTDRRTFLGEWSRDPELLVVQQHDPVANRFLLYALEPKPGGKLTRLVKTGFAMEAGAWLSPDRKWTAYIAQDGPGRMGLYVQPFPPDGRVWTIAPNASAVRWSPSGRNVIYLDGSRVLSTRWNPATSVFDTSLLFQRPFENAEFVLSRDGSRFLMPAPLETPAERRINILVNRLPPS